MDAIAITIKWCTEEATAVIIMNHLVHPLKITLVDEKHGAREHTVNPFDQPENGLRIQMEPK